MAAVDADASVAAVATVTPTVAWDATALASLSFRATRSPHIAAVTATSDAAHDGDTLVTSLNRVAGTIENGVPRLTAQAAAQQLAGSPAGDGLDIVGAMNIYAGRAQPDWIKLEGVLNYIVKGDATYGLGVDEAARML